QPAGAAAQPGPHRLGRHRRAADAAPRPGAAAGRGGARLCRPRGGGAGGGDRAAGAGAGAAGAAEAGRGGDRAGAGDRQAARAEGGLPGPQGQPELRQAAAGPGRGGGAPAVRPPLLQRRGARLRRRDPAGPGPRRRPRVRLRRRRVLPGRRSRARRPGGGAAAMIRLLALLLALAWALPALAQQDGGERIVDYDVDIAPQADGSLELTERITVRAGGRDTRRGMVRESPTRYRDRLGDRVVVDFEVLGVERNGKPEPWFTGRAGNGVLVNTGSDAFLPAPALHAYVL